MAAVQSRHRSKPTVHLVLPPIKIPREMVFCESSREKTIRLVLSLLGNIELRGCFAIIGPRSTLYFTWKPAQLGRDASVVQLAKVSGASDDQIVKITDTNHINHLFIIKWRGEKRS